MKNMVSCNAASKATMLSMGSLELLYILLRYMFLDLPQIVIRSMARFRLRPHPTS